MVIQVMMDTVLLQVNIITNMRYILCVQFKESVHQLFLLWYLLLKVSSVCERESCDQSVVLMWLW